MSMESADEAAARVALQTAVPPLREPIDRVAEVGLRVRRHRMRTATTAALAVVVVLAGAGALELVRAHDGGATAAAADDCPPADMAVPAESRSDDPGPIVPSGAVRIRLCVRPADKALPAPDVDYSPRTLTQNVDELVALANSLPGPESSHGCLTMKDRSEQSFVFGYADGPPVVVWVDRICGILHTVRRTRYSGQPAPLDVFYRLYRAQLRATTPGDTIQTPTCPATHDVRVDTSPQSPHDGIGRNRGFQEALLPDPLVAIAACRYALTDSSWTLIWHDQRRTGLESARLVLNESYADREYPECLGNDPQAMRPTLVDSLWVADATGAVSEVRVWRQPCAVVHTAHSSLRPTGALVAYLNDLLGTPP
jgi:hypothetical protein